MLSLLDQRAVMAKNVGNSLYQINWCALLGFPPLEKPYLLMRKITITFHVFEIANQLLIRHSLYLAP